MLEQLKLLIVMPILFALVTAHAEEPKRSHTITLDDFFSLAWLSEVAISPNGQSVAYADARWQQSTDDQKADLWVVSTTANEASRLTFDRAGYHGIRWSPDGKFVYAIANRKHEGASGPPYDGSTQVWRVALAGGEPFPVTQVSGGIELFDLAADGHSVYFQTSIHNDISNCAYFGFC